MVEIQLDTYTADSISAHRKIRQEAFCPSLTDSLFLSCNSYILHIALLHFLKETATVVEGMRTVSH